MRYGLARGRVLSDFAIRRDDNIEFLVRYHGTKATARDVSKIPCDINDWKAKGSTLRNNALSGSLRRGNADSHTRTLGNLHAVVRPLRAALYARLAVTVEESLPSWINGKFILDVKIVTPDATLDALLNDSRALYAWIRENDAVAGEHFDDRKHASAIAAAELHDAATAPDDRTSATRITSIYRTLYAIAESPVKASVGWCAGGRCAGLRNQACVGTGLCFPLQIESAVYINKDPLCAPCHTKLAAILEASRARKQMNGLRF
jgi:hypothetical protein